MYFGIAYFPENLHSATRAGFGSEITDSAIEVKQRFINF
jgi:hypothetical protein